MQSRPPDWPLPRPDRLHHVVEDFLTSWDGPQTHILPLRRFLETSTGKDMRHFYAEDCLQMALTHQNVPEACQQHYVTGKGLLNEGHLKTSIGMIEHEIYETAPT